VLAKGVEMPVNLHVHEFAQIRGNPQPMVVKETHYMRLKGEGAEFPLYLQNGQVWSENEGPIPLQDWPEWLLPEIERCSSAALAAVGWARPQGVAPPKPLAKPTAKPPSKPPTRVMSEAEKEGRRQRAQERPRVNGRWLKRGEGQNYAPE
jgi:hypothetical protein